MAATSIALNRVQIPTSNNLQAVVEGSVCFLLFVREVQHALSRKLQSAEHDDVMNAFCAGLSVFETAFYLHIKNAESPCA